MLYTHGRIRPQYRHSVLDLDILSTQDAPPSSPSTSTSSGQSFSSLPMNRDRPRTASYNSNILHKMKTITPDDISVLRRELHRDFLQQKSPETRRQSLSTAIDILNDLRQELIEQITSNDEDLSFFIPEYQALIYWLYSAIRFEPSMGQLQFHFYNMKRDQSIILTSLPPKSHIFLECVLRFCRLCLEYAPFCDEESLSWCQTAVARSGRLSASRSSSAMSSASSDSLERIDRRRADYSRNGLLESLQKAVTELERAMAQEAGYSREKRID